MVQRVDVVTGGASAAWGSDAVSGVINLIINKNFTGTKASIDLQDTGQDTRRSYGFTVTNGFDMFGGRSHAEWAVTYNDSPETVFMTSAHWFNNPSLIANPLYNATTNPNVPQTDSRQQCRQCRRARRRPGSNTGAAAALNGIQFGPGGLLENYTLGDCNYYASHHLCAVHRHHHHHHQYRLLWRHGQPVDLGVADRPDVLPAATGHRLLLWQLQDHAGYPGVLDVELWL